MIGTRAPEDPYTLSFESSVASISDRPESDGVEAVLDETYFYAESGGQPPDRGTLGGCAVLDVQERSGEVVHTLAGPINAMDGETIAGEIDPDFRTYCMRAHTASHVLYGAGRRLLDDLGYGGFDISEEKVRVDFETTTEIDVEVLIELERLVNRTVWDSRPVTWAEHPAEAALSRDEIAFNAKTEEGLGDERVRVVEIEGWDAAACGGTHVRNTGEIGPVTVLERSNPGEGLTRVEFAVGPAAIRERAAEREAAMRAARAANTRVLDLPDAIARLEGDRNALADERDALRERLVDRRIAELEDESVEREGETWVIGTIDGLDANALADRAGRVVQSSDDESEGDDEEKERDGAGGDGDGTDGANGPAPTVVALVDSEGRYLAVASGGETDAGAVVERVTSEFGGGGGGSPNVAQGGGLDADPGAVVSFLRDDE